MGCSHLGSSALLFSCGTFATQQHTLAVFNIYILIYTLEGVLGFFFLLMRRFWPSGTQWCVSAVGCWVRIQ